MADGASLLTETAKLLVARELAAVATLHAAPRLAPDQERADAAAWLLLARTRQLDRVRPASPTPLDLGAGSLPASWTVLAVDVTVGAGLEASFFRSLAAHLPAPEDQLVRELLDGEPSAPGLLWSDAGEAPTEARRALHRVVRATTDALLASAELPAVLGRTGTLELFADMLEAFPSLVARAVAAR